MEFREFNKISRLYRDIVITEKLDGTNACVAIGENGEFFTQSRNRMITPEDDNHGFSRWAHDNKDELIEKLGPGHHYGEWWGSGIQRRYGLTEKRWSLFNVGRWADDRPSCCHVVPVLYSGVFEDGKINHAIQQLIGKGSIAAPGFMKPEGIVIYHTHSRQLFKVTLDGDGHKGAGK
jgi:hypothetical protein